MGRLKVVEHEVYRVRRCADENNLEYGVVERMGVVEGPQEVDVSSEVHNQVQELRLERNAGCTLSTYVSSCAIGFPGQCDVHLMSSSYAKGSGSRTDGTSPLKSHC